MLPSGGELRQQHALSFKQRCAGIESVVVVCVHFASHKWVSHIGAFGITLVAQHPPGGYDLGIWGLVRILHRATSPYNVVEIRQLVDDGSLDLCLGENFSSVLVLITLTEVIIKFPRFTIR